MSTYRKVTIKHGFGLLKRTFQYMNENRKIYIIGVLLSSTELGMIFATPILNKKLIEMVSGSINNNAIPIISMLFIAFLLVIPLVVIGNYWINTCANYTCVNLMKDMYSHIRKLDISELASKKTGDYMTRIATDANRAGSVFASFGTKSLIRFIIVFPISLVLLIRTNYIIAIISVIYGLTTLVLSLVFNPYIKHLEQQAREYAASSLNHILEAIRAIPIVRIFNLKENLAHKYYLVCKNIYEKRVKFRAMNGLSYGIIDFFSFSAQAVAFIIAILYLIPNKMDLPQAVYAATLMAISGDAMLRFSSFFLIIQPYYVAQQRCFEILDLPIPSQENTSTNINLKNDIAIEVNNVSFSYDGTNNVLKHINLKIDNGDNIAIVGSSGGGKTTLMKLFQSFYPPSNGSISYFGEPIDSLSQGDIRGLFAYVSQTPAIFDCSIEENISYGNSNATPDDIIVAAKAANIHEYIISLPDGYNSQVGERGMQLSGGQRQRIAIARAFLKKSPILLLDEATAALDSQSERLIQQCLDRLMSSSTTITIAHRLSTILNADRIIVIDAGRIIEEGSHNELMNQKNRYYELYMKQFKE